MSYHSQEKVQIFNLVYHLFYFHCYKKNLAQEGTLKNGLFPLTVKSIMMRESCGQKLEVSGISSDHCLYSADLLLFIHSST